MTFDQIRREAEIRWRAFSQPGRLQVRIGAATCGRAAGALEAKEAFVQELAARSIDGDVELVEVGCLGLCYAEPLVEIRGRDGRRVLYQKVTPELAGRLVRSHLVDNQALWDLALAVMSGAERKGVPLFGHLPTIGPQVRIVLRNCGLIDPGNMDHYIARGGYSGLERALLTKPEQVIDEVTASGLRGRGGAGFPTGAKWRFARRAGGDEKFVICNADEGDPGAFMDRSVLEGDPHAVLEGLVIAGYAIGAATGYVYVRAEYPLAIERIEGAIAQMQGGGLLGRDILGSGFDFEIRIMRGAGAFVCGEETALMASVEGRRGMPRSRPPFPAQRGLFDKPTNINNVETLACVSAIAARGAEWFAQYGTEKSKGTKTFALAGKIKRTGLIEVPMGITLGTIVFDIGGGIPDDKKFKAVQTGGPSGGCIPAQHLNLPVDYEHLAEVGSIMGSGGMVVLDEDSCMVDVARYFLSFTESESCGKCVPCRMGTQHLLRMLTDITEGRGQPFHLEQMKKICQTMKDGSLCGLGQTAPNPVLSTLRYFTHEYQSHIHARSCAASVCSKMFAAPCQHACPVGMDIPSYIALVRAGRLDDAYKILKQTNPFPSICGRVCDQICRARCRRAQLDEPLAIRHLKRFITDHGSHPGFEQIPVTRRQKMAVVGAGPAGLTAAVELKRRGYATTVFEQQSAAGGMLRWGIPAYRLPRRVLEAEIDEVLATGVEMRLNTRIGRDVSFEDLERDFDHIFLATGAQMSAPMEIPGEDAEGVHGAIEFLNAVNLNKPLPVGKHVAIIGGGNSAIDAARSALRLGAERVTVYYRRQRQDMPALPAEIAAASAEGIGMEFLVAPKRVMVKGGKVSGLELMRMEPRDFDSSARRRSEPVAGSEFTAEADTVISAVGQRLEVDFLSKESGVTVKRNRIEVNEQLSTGNAKVWAGGDAVTGPATAIEAIRAGRDAARAIDEAVRTANGEGPWQAPATERIDIPAEVDEDIISRPMTRVPELDAAARRGDFSEVELTYTLAEAVAEACRCLRCDFYSDWHGTDRDEDMQPASGQHG